MDLVERARTIAEKAHAGQFYTGELHGSEPYIVHPAQVVAVLTEFGHTDPKILALGWLHDVVEDTDYTVETLGMELMSEAVAHLVGNVSVEPGKNRKERNTATYPKIRSDMRSVIGKLADRIANVRRSLLDELSTGKSKFKMYQKEYPEFREALYSPSPLTEPMWKHLDSLLN